MNQRELPECINPFKFADQGRHIDGFISVNKLKRLVELLFSNKGSIAVVLVCKRDEGHKAIIKVEIDICLELQCQSCMELMEYIQHSALTFCPVLNEEQVNNLPSDYEAVMLEEDILNLYEAIEDEIILGLPVVANHKIEDCRFNNIKFDTDSPKLEEARENPFKVLTTLKKV